MKRLNSLSDRIINSIKRLFNDKRFVVCVLSTFVVGIIAHGYVFTNLNLTHDSLNEFYASSQYFTWKIQLARYFTPIYSKVTGTLAIYPWSNGLLGLFWISIALQFITKMFCINNKFLIVLLAMMLSVNKTITAVLATFTNEFSSDMFAMLMATIAAYSWSKDKSIFSYLLQILLLIISLATYQAYISVYLMLIIVFSIKKLINDEDIKEIIKNGIKGILIAVVSVVLYYAFYKVVSTITGIYPNTGGYNSIDNVSGAFGNVSLLYEAYIKGLKEIFIPGDSVVKYSYNIINDFLIVTGFVLILKKLKNKSLNLLLVIALIVCVPLVGNAMHILSGTSHDLMYYSFYIALSISLLIGGEHLNSSYLLVIGALITLLTFYNVQSANALYVKRDLQKQSTLFYVSDIVNKLEDYPEYHKYDSKIAIVGELFDNFQAKDLNMIDLSGSQNVAAVTFYTSWKNYFETILNYPVNIVEEQEAYRLSQLEEVKQMPIFPTPGSIQMVDDTIVIKLQWK